MVVSTAEAADSVTGRLKVTALSLTDWLTALNWTVGAAVLSVMVSVFVVVGPRVALVGLARVTGRVKVTALSLTDWLAALNWTVGAAVLSVMVSVFVVVGPGVALVRLPRVTTRVRSGAPNLPSSRSVPVMVPLICPALMTR